MDRPPIVSDAENFTVDVYKNFASKSVTRVGRLGDLKYPAGECADRPGNVYVAEFYGQDVVEYAHAGASRIKTLAAPGFPLGCSIDPTTGNLAVDDAQYLGGNATAIYQVAVSGSNETVVHTAVLTDSCSGSGDNTYVMQPWVTGSAVFGGNHSCKNRFGFWNYPGGGNPRRTLPSGIAPLDGIGATISRP
ncbi:MAG TPA: hypothetical protein VIW73_10665 [Candidatus Cybelea sp.]